MTDNLHIAKQLDAEDPLASFREEFYFPEKNNKPVIYFCGNSLGLQPKNVERAIQQELKDWQTLAIGGYMQAKNPWLYYQHFFREPLSKITGALPQELTVMNTLTVNLHLLMLSFYRPNADRYKIIMEAGAFPSDQYAIETQVKFYGLDPDDAIIEVAPRAGEKTLRTEDILLAIEEQGKGLAMVLFGGINYYTGQAFDMEAITKKAHQSGAIAGFDLAHAVGNIPLRLHDWNVDFAVWCSYKYLNGGPGAVGGAYVHDRYASDPKHLRMAGWWGNDERTRFKMEKGFVAKPDASGWNISTAQVFNMVALKASLEIFERAGMNAIIEKSKNLTDFLHHLLSEINSLSFEIITPKEPNAHGAQLSLYFQHDGPGIHQRMIDAGIVVDYREPGVVRVAPTPLYNSFEDVFRFCEIIKDLKA